MENKLSKEVVYRISVDWNQYFIDEFKGGYPVDEMINIENGYKAGATAEALRSKILLKELEDRVEGLNDACAMLDEENQRLKTSLENALSYPLAEENERLLNELEVKLKSEIDLTQLNGFTPHQIYCWNTSISEAIRKAKLGATIYIKEEIIPVITQFEKLKIKQ